jgi:uncharacterized DUF497 family protein
MIEFEWDPTKARMNLRKHGLAFREAATVFRDPCRLLMVAHTDRGERIRIISARELTRAEREAYEEEIERRKS